MKKGQYYIFSVIILLSVVYLISPKNIAQVNPSTAPKELAENYRREMPYFANNALLNSDETIARNFTNYFIRFAREKGADMSVTYIFTDNVGSTVFSSAKNTSIAAGSMYNLSENNSIYVGKVSFINLTIADKQYNFALTDPSFKAVLIFQSEKSKDVFVLE